MWATPAAPPPPPGAPAPGPAGGLQGLLTPLAQGTNGLGELGKLGAQNGSVGQVKSLGERLVSDSSSITGQLGQAAGDAGVTLPDVPSPDLQATLTQLQGQAGAQFDQSWLQHVQGAQQQAQAAAQNLLAAPDAPAEAKAAAQTALDSLRAGQEQTQQAMSTLAAGSGAAGAGSTGGSGAAGAGSGSAGSGSAGSGAAGSGAAGSGAAGRTPSGVDAGSGGQAAETSTPLLPVVLVGFGLVLLIGAGWLRRRADRRPSGAGR